MMSIFGTDPFINILENKMGEKAKELEKIKGAKAKAKLINDIYHDSLVEYFSSVTKMDEKTFDKYIDNRGDELTKLSIKNQEKLFEISKNNITSEEIAGLVLAREPDEKTINKVAEEIEKKSLNKDNLHKLFLIDFFSKLELYQLMLGYVIELFPMIRIESILKKRFNTDQNWSLAVSILSIQENLVKKKFLDLGIKINSKEFRHQKFNELIDKLKKEIENKENRKVRLSFFKSKGLREVRNQIEHEGFDFKVNSEEVNELLDDIEKFEKELYPD